jgi:copper chaperone CopZ
MMISTYTVQGMTCEHCVHAVTEEVSAIPGVEQAAVELASGSLTVTSDKAIDFSLIEAAVDEAGDYTVAAA